MNKFLRSIYIGLMLLVATVVNLSAQTVTTVNELIDAVNRASDSAIIVLDPTLTPETVMIPMPNVNVTIDAGNVIWNAGNIIVTNVVRSGPGTLVIENLEVDGSGISGRLLKNNASGGDLILNNCKFYNATGGAIETAGSSTTIINRTRIYDNRSGAGPAVWVGGNASSSVEINNSTIERNSGTAGGYQGGAIASNFYEGILNINNTVFRDNVNKCANTGVIGGGGGAMALHFLRGKVSINECLFEGNKSNGEGMATIASTYDGGAIYVFDGGNNNSNASLTITNTTFHKNLAYDDGGAMMIQGTSSPGLITTITNCTFFENRAYGLNGGNRSGGAIQFYRNGFVGVSMTNTILGSTFVGNISGNENTTVVQQGGAIGMSGSGLAASVVRNGSLFVGNSVYGSNGQVNMASGYKDVSNTNVTQAGGFNVVNVDKGDSPAYTAEDVLGKNYAFCENLSGIKAGVDDEIIKTIPIKPGGIADFTYSGSVALPSEDQRGFYRNKDQGAVEIAWVRFNAGTGDWTGLNDNLAYEGEEYYESASGSTKHYYKITNATGTVSAPTASLLTPPTGEEFDKWVLEIDGTTEWNPADTVQNAKYVIALYKPAAINYTVTYKPGIGSGADYIVSSVVSGTNHTILNYNDPLVNFTPPANSVFNGWKDIPGNSFSAGGAIVISSDTTLIAQWKDTTPPPVPTITVTYHPNDGGGIDHTINSAADGSHTILNYTDNPLNYTEPTANHTFVNWNTKADGSGVFYPVGLRVFFSEDTDLYAQWIKNDVPPSPSDPEAGINITPGAPFCPTDAFISISYDVLYKNNPLEYIVVFSEEAKNAGFKDIETYTELPDKYITIAMPSGISKGRYAGKVVLRSLDNTSLITDYFFELDILSGVVIVRQPESAEGCQGDIFTLSVEASGDALNYQWYYKDEKIVGATSAEYSNSLSAETAGLYYVIVSGACGAFKSDLVYATMHTLSILMKWDDVLYVDNTDNRYVKYQWYKDGIAIIEYGTSIYYTDAKGLNGSYTVRAYYADGTYDESCALHFTLDSPRASLKVYPNPVRNNSYLTIEGNTPSSAKTNYLIELFDLSGRKIYTTSSDSEITTVPVNAASGVYLLHVTAPNGKKTVTKVVVK